jgi:hypothetical protein
LKNREKEIQDL